jgi:hypothetical protein
MLKLEVYPQMSKKTALFRLGVLVLALFVTHVLLLWWHPMGQHQFFWNLALGALSFWVILRLAIPHLKDKSPETQHQQGLPH